MSAFGGEADIGRTEDDRNELLSVAKTGIEPSLLRSSGFADVHLRTKIGWDNIKNTLWDSMERLSGVGQDKHLKLHFYLRPPLGTFHQN
jgi:hypothetical protein